jgi:hypothetical protein
VVGIPRSAWQGDSDHPILAGPLAREVFSWLPSRSTYTYCSACHTKTSTCFSHEVFLSDVRYCAGMRVLLLRTRPKERANPLAWVLRFVGDLKSVRIRNRQRKHSDPRPSACPSAFQSCPEIAQTKKKRKTRWDEDEARRWGEECFLFLILGLNPILEEKAGSDCSRRFTSGGSGLLVGTRTP